MFDELFDRVVGRPAVIAPAALNRLAATLVQPVGFVLPPQEQSDHDSVMFPSHKTIKEAAGRNRYVRASMGSLKRSSDLLLLVVFREPNSRLQTAFRVINSAMILMKITIFTNLAVGPLLERGGVPPVVGVVRGF